ncbi:TIGR03088 family PEP-CTERM/XrtA system glycosyltransferase [Inhella sp.]|uniref:TIGR03088 family PEP-CTERM/XrtA system glycosyltransferase n=1 Tax=Inhella sp. TaxID=1921806 RepID=UPI0035B34592
MKPLVLHLLYRFDTGGLENGVVNLINRLDGYRHAVLAIDHCAPAFCERVQRADTEFISLRKPPGQTVKLLPRVVRELRRLQPAVVHSRNLAALELQPAAWWARVPVRLHGEHGRDTEDLHGLSRRHQWMRRLNRPFVQHWVALSGELESYLSERVGVPPERITRICNGVDTQRFQAPGRRQPIEGSPFNDPALFLFGTVGRMQPVKAQTLMVQAFIKALQSQPALRERARLVLIGDGPLRAQCAELLQSADMAHLAWLPGERRDVPQLLQGMDAFVLPSLGEGISNTILEAMATGLPVLAAAVGGNPELVQADHTGALVPAGDVAAFAGVMAAWAREPQTAQALGVAARLRAEQQFSLGTMVQTYDALYARALNPSN